MNSQISMGREEKAALLEAILGRAAEILGDITGPVMEEYYRVFPEARASFEEHGLGKTAALEAEMVESVLYCLIYWLERPLEIEIIFSTSVPHHIETLNVPDDFYAGLVEAAANVIARTVPDDAVAERAVLQEISKEITGAIRKAALPV